MAKQSFSADVDTTLPEVAITIGGEERSLCFDMAAISRVERLTGINLFNAVLDEPGAFATTAMLYSALLHDDPELKLEEVQSWVNLRNRLVILTAVRAAWFGSIPEPVKVADGASEGEVTAQGQPKP